MVYDKNHINEIARKPGIWGGIFGDTLKQIYQQQSDRFGTQWAT